MVDKRDEELKRVPPLPPFSDWPEGVRGISIGETDGLGVSESGEPLLARKTGRDQKAIVSFWLAEIRSLSRCYFHRYRCDWQRHPRLDRV